MKTRARTWPESDGLTNESTRTRLRWTAVTHLTLTTLLIVWNYVSNTGLFGATVGEVSRRLDNVFTPASYAFSIWGPIYLGLLALGIYEVRLALRPAPAGAEVRDDERFILALGPWFSGAQIVCGAWLAAWLTGEVGASLLCMATLFALLMVCVLKTNMERWNAPSRVILFLWWPLSLYSGWISVALLANVSAYLAHLQVPLVQDSGWGIALGALVVVGHCAIVWRRNMREFSLVGAWALTAVSIRHLSGPHGDLSRAAAFGAGVLVINALIHATLHFETPPNLKAEESPSE